MSTIALLTDFGLEDTYVGVMKAVIASISPETQVIDLSHAIMPQNIRQGAFELLTSYTYFPPETIFVVVVDPGVGSQRRPLAARAGEYSFIAPDNGVLSYALRRDPNAQVYELSSAQHRLSRVSNTFHGRDVFAPAAAYLARGESIQNLGAAVDHYVQLPLPRLEIEEDRVRGESVHIDHFGNVVTSIGLMTWTHAGELALHSPFDPTLSPLKVAAATASIEFDEWRIQGISRTYADAPRGGLLALVGSSGFLEIGMNQGSAALQLGAGMGYEFDLILG